MPKTIDILFLTFLLVLFTSLFIKIPVGITCTFIRKPLYMLTQPYTIETCTINELFFVKLLVTFLMYKNTKLTVWQFGIFMYAIELVLFAITKKCSLMFHPIVCIYLYNWLQKNYDKFNMLMNSFTNF